MNRVILACLVATSLLGCDLMKRKHAEADAGAALSASSSAAAAPSAAPSVGTADTAAPAQAAPPSGGSAPGVIAADPNAPPATEAQAQDTAAQATITKANYKSALDKLEKEDLNADKK